MGGIAVTVRISDFLTFSRDCGLRFPRFRDGLSEVLTAVCDSEL
jgi:hypothetical protein